MDKQSVITSASELALDHFINILKKKLGESFSDRILSSISIDEVDWDKVIFKNSVAEFKDNFDSLCAKDILDIIKPNIKDLANTVLKELKDDPLSEIYFCECPSATPFIYHSPIPKNNVTLRIACGLSFASVKYNFEVSIIYIKKRRIEMAKPKLGSGARFKALSNKIQKEGKSKESVDAIAASVGRKKYGAKKMASMAAKGRKK